MREIADTHDLGAIGFALRKAEVRLGEVINAEMRAIREEISIDRLDVSNHGGQ